MTNAVTGNRNMSIYDGISLHLGRTSQKKKQRPATTVVRARPRNNCAGQRPPHPVLGADFDVTTAETLEKARKNHIPGTQLDAIVNSMETA